MACETLIIHLERATARWAQVERLRALTPCRVVTAVDGETLAETDIAAVYARRMHFPAYPMPLRRGEVAAFLSHRKAWRMIVDGGAEAAVIVEDDIDLEPATFARALDLALAYADADRFVRFPVSARDWPGRVIARDGAIALFESRLAGRGCHAQLVGRNAAVRLLERSEKFDRPVDDFTITPWISGVRPLTVLPNGVSEISDRLDGSLIGRRKTLGERMKRETLRPLYRAALALRTLAGRIC